MKKLFFSAAIAALFVTSVASCGQKSKTEQSQEETVAIDAAHNSQNSLDWEGTYAGFIPCANCEGIKVRLTLNPDGTYQMTYQYVGKSNTEEQFSGTFVWDESGSRVELSDKTAPHYYIVGENQLFQLDMEGNPITGELADKYVLTKE